jgi:hypothetical protein
MTAYATNISDDKNCSIAMVQQVIVSIPVLDTTKTKPAWIHSKTNKPVGAEALAKHWMFTAK